MIKLVKILQEANNQKYEFGCVMLYFSFPKIDSIHKLIDPKDIYYEDGDESFGLEKDTHITLLFGLHEEVTTEEVTKILDKFHFGKCILYNPSIFKNEKYDVLKFDVRYPTKGGAFLHKCNKELCKLPHTTNFPEYIPHMTIGYLKPGTANKYLKVLKELEYVINPEYVVYSKPDRTKIKIPINNESFSNS